MIPTRACSRCGRQIGWVTTSNGRRMPIDPEPNKDGNVIVRREGRSRLVADVLSKDRPRPRGVAFMPHFATCGKTPAAPKPAPPVQPSLGLDD